MGVCSGLIWFFIFFVNKPLFGVLQGQCLRLHIQRFKQIGKTELICPQLYFNRNHRTIIRMQHYSLAMNFPLKKSTLDLQGTNLFYIKSQQTKTTNLASWNLWEPIVVAPFATSRVCPVVLGGWLGFLQPDDRVDIDVKRRWIAFPYLYERLHTLSQSQRYNQENYPLWRSSNFILHWSNPTLSTRFLPYSGRYLLPTWPMFVRQGMCRVKREACCLGTSVSRERSWWERSWSSANSRWWFQIFFIFIPIWGRFPIWLIFFRWVETTN